MVEADQPPFFPFSSFVASACVFTLPFACRTSEYTDPVTVYKIREAVRNGRSLDVEILNYRRDGLAFWNRFRHVMRSAVHVTKVVELMSCCVFQDFARTQEGQDDRRSDSFHCDSKGRDFAEGLRFSRSYRVVRS